MSEDIRDRVKEDDAQKQAPFAASAPHRGSPAKPLILVDYERYAHLLDDEDLTEDQKQEFLQTLWSIIVEFVSLGFNVHPLQQVSSGLDKNQKSFLSIDEHVLSLIHSENTKEEGARTRPKEVEAHVGEES